MEKASQEKEKDLGDAPPRNTVVDAFAKTSEVLLSSL